MFVFYLPDEQSTGVCAVPKTWVWVLPLAPASTLNKFLSYLVLHFFSHLQNEGNITT